MLFAKVFAKNVFINQKRKLEDRRRSAAVLVLTINNADSLAARECRLGIIGIIGKNFTV